MQPTANPARKWPRYDGVRRPVRRALAIAVVLAAAGAAAWWAFGRGDDVPAAGEGAASGNPAGASPAAAGLHVTGDPKKKAFTRAETLAGTAPPTEVRGVVEGPDGAPLGGIRVTARSRLPFRPAATAVTRADGAFRLLDVDEALLDVSLGNLPEDWSGPAAIARAGGPALRLRLERKKPKGPSKAVAVAITVLDPEGLPIPHARVKVQGRYDEENFVHADSETTEADGVARLEVTDPSAHLWFAVERPEGRDDVFDLQIDGWKAQDAVIRLDRAVKLTGMVVSSDGKPVSEAYVAWRRKGSEEGGGLGTREDGKFEGPQMPPGRVEVFAFPSRVGAPFPPDARPTDVDPRAGPVTLRLGRDPGWIVVKPPSWSDSWIRTAFIAREPRPGLLLEVEEFWNPEPGRTLSSAAVSAAARYMAYLQRGDGKVAVARDLAPGPRDAVVPLMWQDGRTIRITVTWTGEETWRSVPRIRFGGDTYLDAEPPDGQGSPSQEDMKDNDFVYVMRSLPEGTWHVVAEGTSADDWFVGEADVEAGEAANIVVKRLTRTRTR
jgi:hypothetical protein